MAATLAVLRAADRAFGLQFVFESAAIGWAAHRAGGTTFPDSVFEKAKAADGVLLGPVSHNEYPPLPRAASIRPANCASGSTSSPTSGRRDRVPGSRPAAACRSISSSCARIPKASMPTARCISVPANSCRRRTLRSRCARSRGKARRGSRKPRSSLPCSGARKSPPCTRPMCCACRTAFTSTACARWPRATPDVAYEERIIDAMAALLVRDASQFDVVVTTNMYGDILSDEASEIAGSLGLAASLNAGSEHAVAQAQHGSAPDIAGKNIANPSSLIGSAAMLLAWLGERRRDDRLAPRSRGDRGRARQDHRRSEHAHTGHGRHARHRCVRRGGGEAPSQAGAR